MRLVPIIAITALAGCGDDDSSGVRPDAGVHVMGCDDPAVWTSPAPPTQYLWVETGGGACAPAQFPLQHTWLMWSPPEEDRANVDRTCWRITDASPGSGWTAGQRFESTTDRYGELMITGFSLPITVEGRVLLRDGTLKYALAPETAKTRPARIVEPAANALVFVMDSETWAERNAVHLWGQTIATDEVLGATGSEFEYGYIYTVHRTAAGIVMRSWWRDAQAQIMSAELALGSGTRVQLARFGGAIAIDDQLLFIEHVNLGPMLAVRHFIPLGSEPLEIVGEPGSVILHMAGSLVRYEYFKATPTPTSTAIGDGHLVPAEVYHPPYFFDGATFRELDYAGGLGFSALSITPSAGDLAALGAPIAAPFGVVFGERGLLAALDVTSPLPGPRFASYGQLYGGGTLGPIGARLTTYAIVSDDGTAAIYEAPYSSFCD